MQDTVDEQASLLRWIFEGRSIVQRFGDDRQAIFGSAGGAAESAAFPSKASLPMCRSYRLSPSIAQLVQNVCDGEVEQLIGNVSRPACNHTVFVFARKSIDLVLPAFASLVSREVGVGIDSGLVKAVGASSQVREEPRKFPSAIGDYWQPFVARKPQSNSQLNTFAEYLGRAQVEIRRGKGVAEARRILLDAAVTALALQEVRNDSRSFTPAALLARIRAEDPRAHRAFCAFLAELCLQLSRDCVTPAAAAGERLCDLLAGVHDQGWNDRVLRFLNEDDGRETATHDSYRSKSDPQNVFVRRTPDGPLAVEVGTIHSVKGETLGATLVLETHVYSHDLRELIKHGYLCGLRPEKRPGKHLADHLKRTYVAMSRPTGLVCLAVLDTHLEPQHRTSMTKLGWRFVDI